MVARSVFGYIYLIYKYLRTWPEWLNRKIIRIPHPFLAGLCTVQVAPLEPPNGSEHQ